MAHRLQGPSRGRLRTTGSRVVFLPDSVPPWLNHGSSNRQRERGGQHPESGGNEGLDPCASFCGEDWGRGPAMAVDFWEEKGHGWLSSGEEIGDGWGLTSTLARRGWGRQSLRRPFYRRRKERAQRLAGIDGNDGDCARVSASVLRVRAGSRGVRGLTWVVSDGREEGLLMGQSGQQLTRHRCLCCNGGLSAVNRTATRRGEGWRRASHARRRFGDGIARARQLSAVFGER